MRFKCASCVANRCCSLLLRIICAQTGVRNWCNKSKHIHFGWEEVNALLLQYCLWVQNVPGMGHPILFSRASCSHLQIPPMFERHPEALVKIGPTIPLRSPYTSSVCILMYPILNTLFRVFEHTECAQTHTVSFHLFNWEITGINNGMWDYAHSSWKAEQCFFLWRSTCPFHWRMEALQLKGTSFFPPTKAVVICAPKLTVYPVLVDTIVFRSC